MFSFISALANFITKIIPMWLMRKAGADSAIKKGLEKSAKLRTKKDKIKKDINRSSPSDVVNKLLGKWTRGK